MVTLFRPTQQKPEIVAAFGKQESGSICGLLSGLKSTFQFSPKRNLTCKHPANSPFGIREIGQKNLLRQDKRGIELQNPPNSNIDRHVCAF
jgi:hypothetical protein